MIVCYYMSWNCLEWRIKHAHTRVLQEEEGKQVERKGKKREETQDLKNATVSTTNYKEAEEIKR